MRPAARRVIARNRDRVWRSGTLLRGHRGPPQQSSKRSHLITNGEAGAPLFLAGC